MIKQIILTYLFIFFLKPTERSDVCYLSLNVELSKNCDSVNNVGFTTDYKDHFM